VNGDRLKVAIVTPRYGREVGGGAERLARDYATRLAGRMSVEVLTTCALDYRTWADHFPPGASEEDGVLVHRFRVSAPRDEESFDSLSGRVLGAGPTHRRDEERWMDAQGPNAPGLLEHLAREGDRYDAVLFIPYLYATTVRGLPLVRDRAVLVPALHDEPPLRLAIFRSIIEAPRSLVFSTPEERDLAAARFDIEPSRCHLVGAGVDPPPAIDADLFQDRYGRDRPYLVCVGRIDPSKGSGHLLDHHRALRRLDRGAPGLVMIGPSAMPLPQEPWLVTPGFVDEDVKHSAIAGALALVCPSPYESLSLVLLEAWAHGVPTVCASGSPVLVGQSRRSGGGIWYRDGDEYAECIRLFARSPALVNGLGRNGWRFTRTLTWPSVISRLETALQQAAAGSVRHEDHSRHA